MVAPTTAGSMCEHGPMAATFADYLWFEQMFPDLSEAYCITLIKGGRRQGCWTGSALSATVSIASVSVSSSNRVTSCGMRTTGMFISSRRRRLASGPWVWRPTAFSA